MKKTLVDSTGTKGAKLEDKFFCSMFFAAFSVYLDGGKGHKTAMCFFENGLGRLKLSRGLV